MDIDDEKILFWDHESSHPEKDFLLIANTFEEFILSLVDEPVETDDNVSDVEIEILDNDFGKLLFGRELTLLNRN